MLISLLLAASSGVFSPVMTFTRSPSFDPRPVKIEIGHLRGGETFHYWFKRTVGRKSAPATWWTDTTRCPAARSIVSQAVRLERPNIFVVGVNSASTLVTADGVEYGVETEAAYPGSSVGTIKFSTNFDTPLARWVDESLRTLEPCWTRERPKHGPRRCWVEPGLPGGDKRLCAEAPEGWKPEE